MAKMDKKWVALCSAAVAAVYATGLYLTEDQTPAIASSSTRLHHLQIQTETEQHTQNQQAQSTPSAIGSTTAGSASSSSSSDTTAAPKVNEPKQLYQDGTFSGKGHNRRGSIEVTVTLKHDKITDVEITDYGMHYPESDIAGLPGEVLQKQSSDVSIVSGATYSSKAFAEAVSDALTSAQNA